MTGILEAAVALGTLALAGGTFALARTAARQLVEGRGLIEAARKQAETANKALEHSQLQLEILARPVLTMGLKFTFRVHLNSGNAPQLIATVIERVLRDVGGPASPASVMVAVDPLGGK